jgi:hypothetical protein
MKVELFLYNSPDEEACIGPAEFEFLPMIGDWIGFGVDAEETGYIEERNWSEGRDGIYHMQICIKPEYPDSPVIQAYYERTCRECPKKCGVFNETTD